MTRHSSDTTPSASTRRRAAALGVDVGVMDAVDALRPRLSVTEWRALAARAGRPIEDVMLDELMPSRGLGMQDWEPDTADDPDSSEDSARVYEGPESGDDSASTAHEQRAAGEHHPTEREWEEASDRYGSLMCSTISWEELEAGEW